MDQQVRSSQFSHLVDGPFSNRSFTTGAQDRIGVTIESTSAIAFVGLLNAMSIFPADRNLYLHEAKSSARYSPATFVITYSLVEVGFELLGGFGYGAIASTFTFLSECRANLDVDERRYRHADFNKDIFRILHIDLGNGQYG